MIGFIKLAWPNWWHELSLYKLLWCSSLTLNWIPNNQCKINLGGRVLSNLDHRLTIKLRGIRQLFDNLDVWIELGIRGKQYMWNLNSSFHLSYISLS